MHNGVVSHYFPELLCALNPALRIPYKKVLPGDPRRLLAVWQLGAGRATPPLALSRALADHRPDKRRTQAEHKPK